MGSCEAIRKYVSVSREATGLVLNQGKREWNAVKQEKET